MKVGIIQIPPVFNDITATLELAEQLLSDAVSHDIDLLVFGESWFCGYPAWIDYCGNTALWDEPNVKNVYRHMFENALVLGSKHMQNLQELIKKSGIYVVMGANEAILNGPGNGSLYNACFIFGKDGKILNHHRKLVPTYTEKLVHTHGDAYGLKSVDTEFGRIGALICWEHWMPLSRHAMHDESEDLHIALWPTVKEMNIVAGRHYAFEGRCHVICVGSVMPISDTPDGLQIAEKYKSNKFAMRGGSTIIAPNGDILLGPVYEKSEMLVYDFGDLRSNIGERMNLSVSGNYQRPEIFDLNVNKKRMF